MDILSNVLQVLQRALNQYLQNIARREDDWVVLSSLVDAQRAMWETCRDKLVLALYNLTSESAVNVPAGAQSGTDSCAVVPAPLYLNLHLVCMANFSGTSYAVGLEALSRAIAFFQQNPAFTRDTAADLSPSVSKILLSFASLNPVEVNYVMGLLGVTYLPSAFYTLRLVPFASTAMRARAYPVRGTSGEGAIDGGEGG